ncbi:UDP-N-acetylgalactosamine-undecaprenyl-phosphate N-acetylgalactosaminephosphotransferase [bacterium BMS3Abin03]|nr:UDP-N-acetylgalactosamine-undecaprenyl-phosphate N-acetylgalactosaminephosphotransferase [bacterium BMS3Abin03]
MGKQGSFIKRFTDLVFSIIILIISIPILLIAAIAIKLDSKGPVFFVQERTGLGGKSFKMLKLRGMVHNALQIGPQLTQVNDPRITRVGKFLRRTSIDEIPQAINVLKGEMSLVGPRPEIVSITKQYTDEQKKVFNYKPGITGYSQVNGRQTLSPEERVKMETEYYSKANFRSDLKLIFNTFKVIVSNEGNI